MTSSLEMSRQRPDSPVAKRRRLVRYGSTILGVLATALVVTYQVLDADTGLGNANEYVDMVMAGPSDTAVMRASSLTPHQKSATPTLMASLGNTTSRAPEPVTPESEQVSTGAGMGPRTVMGRVRRGDTFSKMMRRYQVPLKTALDVANASKSVFDVARKIKPGRQVLLSFDGSDRLTEMTYLNDKNRTLVVSRREDGRFKARMNDRERSGKPDGEAAPVVAAAPTPTSQTTVKSAANMTPPSSPTVAYFGKGGSSALPMRVNIAPRKTATAAASSKNTPVSAAAPKRAAKSQPTRPPMPTVAALPVKSRAVRRVSPKAVATKKATEPRRSTTRLASRRDGKLDRSKNRAYRPAGHMREAVVRPGDNLTQLLQRENVSHVTSMKVARDSKKTFNLARQLKPGRKLQLAFDNSGLLVGLRYPLGDDRTFWMDRANSDSPFKTGFEAKDYNARVNVVTGVINGSLFEAGRKAGLSRNLMANLANLFEWDVDFARDIRTGDRFTVLFEELSDGVKTKQGNILAAEFINQGRTYRVVRYTDPKGNSGYFDDRGRNIQKMFIRAPVDYTRISSRFSLRRKHPVFGFTRAHKGVDYAAPTGTPIRAAGDGKVVWRGRKGGFGNLVMIRHNSKYTTAYAHMSRYNRKVKRGTRVKQGQVIGYVGMTGAATGPHLHYEVRIHGRQVNPLTAKLPSSQPIARRYLADFRSKSRKVLDRLDAVKRTQVASLSKRHRNR
ncbi:MAG: peptidoglycan DD-metalloendopeptidase family protein [Magnetococcales bacterium]|nr:peptidoglycan DD-metalloendopeptidase family protein [Magnetococcales bacterium]